MCVRNRLGVFSSALFAVSTRFRLALPFTYWICYQYTVIARSYAITTLTLFVTAYLFRKRPKGIIALAVALAAMANANAPGLAMAAGFAAAYAWIIFRERRLPGRGLPSASRALMAVLILAGGAAVSVWVARPAPDQNFSPTRMGTILMRFHLMSQPPPINDVFLQRRPALSFRQMVMKGEKEFANPISPVPALSGLLAAMIIWQLWRRRLKIMVLPLAALCLFLLLVFAADWHFGLIAVTLLALLWVAWPDSARYSFRLSRDEIIPAIPLAAMCAIQIAWTIHAIGFDLKYPYSGSAACAKYLKTEASGRKIFSYGYWSVAVAAYFDGSRFANHPDHAYWLWSYRNTIDSNLNRLDEERPDLVLVTASIDPNSGGELLAGLPSRALELVEAHGYVPVKSFSAYMPMRGGFKEKDNYYVLRRR